ncbi:MAG: hypothetical protein A2314_09630 [Elusimicrobia bacterium RIFOXYB2_FULL_50_12]|nr:MAG: hypothetical protein A2314_09630 [Elusimicrobia bacterium RIFOXYB2_FULL_50_12]
MKREQFRQLLSERIVILDGAMGTELQKRGFLDGAGAPEELNVKYPERIRAVHRDYLAAGADIIVTNTFGANRPKLSEYHLAGELESVNRAAVKLAMEEAKPFNALVAGDIGPVGAYLTPLGQVTFDEAYGIFAEQARALSSAGADILIIETMAEIRELKAAILAAKDNFNGPVMAQMTFTSDGTTVTGTDVLSFAAICQAMEVDALGLNCSVGPKDLAALAKIITSSVSLPVSFKPNAGMPRLINRKTVFPGTPEEFVAAALEAFGHGVNMFGGCCGTTPEFIALLSKMLKGKNPAPRTAAPHFYLSSRTKTIDIAATDKLIMVGERINPTNRKSFQEELLAGNFATLRREARAQVSDGAGILDINLGLPGADERALMARAVEEIQEVVSVPLCLDSSLAAALEEGLKACAGKPIINSVNGDDQKLAAILPLAKRYGAAIIGLCTDEKGIPRTAAERIAIAERILAAAQKYGLGRSEIIFDFLTLAASAMPEQLAHTLEAIRIAKQRWPEIKTILGISNVSFGLPARQALNSAFLNLAREAGLTMAILNPHERWDAAEDAIARNLLLGRDSSATAYIARYGNMPKKTQVAAGVALPQDRQLYAAVVEGNREEIARIMDAVLESGLSPLETANKCILPALAEVGEKFGRKEYFLPQVILSAEAAQAAFAKLKPLLKKDSGFGAGKIILATVKGDVHDIGKNIVAAVLESHGWEVIDLGKNVDAETILEAARREKSQLVGLSALMTTTMLEMEAVVEARNKGALPFKIIVGGAPVTERFAKEIGADAYAKDAVEAAKTAKNLITPP